MAKENKQQRSPIILNKARHRFVAPLRIEGQELAAFKMEHIDPGLNKPMDAELWERIRKDKAVNKAIEEGTIRMLDNVSEIDVDLVDHVLKNCALVDSVRWWDKVERRPKVQAKIAAWIEAIEVKFSRRRQKLETTLDVGVA